MGKNNLTLSKDYKNKTIIKLPELIGDTQIWVGQAVMMMIRMAFDNNLEYSDKQKHSFKVEFMDSILKELDITPEEIVDYRSQQTDEY